MIFCYRYTFVSTQQTQHTHTHVHIPPQARACNTIKACLKTAVHSAISHSLFLQTKRINGCWVGLVSVALAPDTRRFNSSELWHSSTAKTAGILLNYDINLLFKGKSHQNTQLGRITVLDIVNVSMPSRSHLTTLYLSFMNTYSQRFPRMPGASQLY